MADVAESIADFLTDHASIAAIVAGRVYPDAIEQGAAMPAIVYWKVSTDHEHTVQGLAGAAATRIEIECYADTRTASHALAKAVKDALMPEDESHPIRGLVNGTTFLDVMLDQGQRAYDLPPTEGNDEHRYVITQDFVFTHLE